MLDLFALGVFLVLVVLAATWFVRYRRHPWDIYYPKLAWLRAGMYFCCCYLLSWWTGAMELLVTSPIATAEQLADKGWLLFTAGVYLFILVAYSGVWSYFTPVFERTSTPPWALQGGGEGRPAELEVTLPDGTSRHYVKATAVLMPPGTVVRGTSGGGGGYGPPSERDPARVHADLREGYISEAAARRHYPHAFTGGAK